MMSKLSKVVALCETGLACSSNNTPGDVNVHRQRFDARLHLCQASVEHIQFKVRKDVIDGNTFNMNRSNIQTAPLDDPLT